MVRDPINTGVFSTSGPVSSGIFGHPFVWITPKFKGHWVDLLFHDNYCCLGPLVHVFLTETGLLL